MSTRDNILSRLHHAQKPFENYPAVIAHQIVAPVPSHSDLVDIFTDKARLLSAHIHHANDQDQALEHLFAIIGNDKQVMAWDFEHIPLNNLPQALQIHGISVGQSDATDIRIGITGADAGLAMTGSLVISTQAGKQRHTSLLPPVHIAVLRREQILPHLDEWILQQSKNIDSFRQIGNHIIISGASRTADIAMELVLGAHGPATLHIIII